MDSDPSQSRDHFLPFQVHMQGSAASSGIAIGSAVVVPAPHVRLLHWHTVPPSDRNREMERYRQALVKLLDSIRISLASAPLVGDAHAIIESYELIATDPIIEDAIATRILNDGMPAEVAVSTAYDAHINALAESSDPFLRERRFELENLRQKLVAILLSQGMPQQDWTNAIVVAPSLLASDVVHYHRRGVIGFVTEVGGITSHACIVARTLGLPAVIGVRNATTIIATGTPLIVDGSRGHVIVNPAEDVVNQYQQLKHQYEHPARPLQDHPVSTRDGITIPVYASIDTPDDVPAALQHGADGIGLVRTEILLARLQHFPSETEQYKWYHAIAERAYPKPVTLRVFDVGSDKIIHGMPYEVNPALGLRGIRFLLQRRDIFRAQLRAILRASVHRNVRILLPLITTVEELVAANEVLRAAQNDLRAAEQAFDEHIPLGIMVETPAVALLAEHFASHVNFFSIGTNDLTQYTLAADRTSDLVAHIFDQLNPAVLRLLHRITTVAFQHGIEVELCGDLATFLSATELLVGIGIRAFSVAPSYIPSLKEKIARINIGDARHLVEQVLQCADSAEVHALLNEQYIGGKTPSKRR